MHRSFFTAEHSVEAYNIHISVKVIERQSMHDTFDGDELLNEGRWSDG